jgi:TatA/E family protein of Tat protein translocase
VPERDVQECVDEGHRRRNEHDDVVIVSAIEDALNPGGIWRAGIRQYRQGRHRRQQEQQRERTEQLRQSHLGPSLRPKRATVSTGNIPPGWIGSRLKEAGCMRANDPAREGPPAMIGSQDLVVGLVIVLVLFGAKKLPELAGSLGKSMKGQEGRVRGDRGGTGQTADIRFATCRERESKREEDSANLARS